MGYRSDTAIEFYSVDEDKVGVIKLWLLEHLPFSDWGGDDFSETTDGFRFYVEDVKWYDGYPEVAKMEALIDAFSELFCNELNVDGAVGAVEFARVGENDDDTEIRRDGTYDYRVRVNRAIQFD
jgi:hypothetical protein